MMGVSKEAIQEKLENICNNKNEENLSEICCMQLKQLKATKHNS